MAVAHLLNVCLRVVWPHIHMPETVNRQYWEVVGCFAEMM